MHAHFHGTSDYGDSEVLLSYRGKVTDDHFDTILQLVEHKLDQEETSRSVKRKIFKILVESLQNVYHHFDELRPNRGVFPMSFTLEKDKLAYSISTGNHIQVTKVDQLKTFIDYINQMDANELKSFYRDRLGNGSFSDGGGAGLGMVDIIRKSGEKITYNFRPVNEDYSYFSLTIKISA